MRRLIGAIAALTLTGCQSSPTGYIGAALGLDSVSGAPPAPIPLTAPVVEPAPEAPAATVMIARTGGGVATGPSASKTPTGASGVVLDDAEQAIAGARVRFLDGREAITGPDGRYDLAGPGGPLSVTAPGYVPSWVMGEGGEAVLHLRRAARVSAPFDQRTIPVSGTVAWDAAGHGPGLAYYVDTAGSVANPVPVSDDGEFAFTVTSVAAGSPRAAVFVLATDGSGAAAYGQTASFAPFDGEPVPALSLAPLSRSVPFSVSDRPASLDAVTSRVECVVANGPVLDLEGPSAASGAVMVPESLAAPMRLVVEAHDAPGDRRSIVRLPVGAALLAASFLPVPELEAFDGGPVRWRSSAGAIGYRVSVAAAGAGLVQEAWVPGALGFDIGGSGWPVAGVVTVEAIDGLGTREIAAVGPRHLRLEPWESLATYRLASCKHAF